MADSKPKAFRTPDLDSILKVPGRKLILKVDQTESKSVHSLMIEDVSLNACAIVNRRSWLFSNSHYRHSKSRLRQEIEGVKCALFSEKSYLKSRPFHLILTSKVCVQAISGRSVSGLKFLDQFTFSVNYEGNEHNVKPNIVSDADFRNHNKFVVSDDGIRFRIVS